MINDEEIVQWGYLLDPAFQLINSAGKPLTNGYIEVYYHGTRTKYYCASDFDGTLHPFKIPLDSLGSNIVLADPAFAYDIYIYNAFGSLIMSRYNVTPGKGGGASGGITAADAEHWLGQYGATQQLEGNERGQTLALPSRPDYQGEFIDHIDYGYINGDETNQYPKYMYLKPGLYLVNCVIRFQQKAGTEVNRLDELLVYTGNGNANEDVAWQLDETGPLADGDCRHCLKLSFVRKVLDEGVTSSVDCSNILYFAPAPQVDWSDAYIQTLQVVKLGVSTAAATKYAAGDYITIVDNVIGVTGLQPASAMDQYVTNDTFNETVSSIYVNIESVTGDVADIQDALDDKKDKQTPYSASGSVTKTITAISQNENGDITVTYEDIDLPPQVPQVEIVSPNDTIAVSSYTDTDTNTKTFTIDVNAPDSSFWAGPTSGFGEYITDTDSHLLPMDTSPFSHRGDDIIVEDGVFKLKKGVYFFHGNVMLRPSTAQNVRQQISIYANSNRASYPWDRTVNSGDTTVPICGIVNASTDDYTLSFNISADTACAFYASIYEGDVFRIDGIGTSSGGGGSGEEYFPGEGIAIDQYNYIKVKIGDGLAFDAHNRLTVSGDFVSHSELESATAVIENTIEGVSATIIEQVSGDVININETINNVTGDIQNIEGDISNLTEVVNNVTGDVQNITNIVEGVTGDLSYVSSAIDYVSGAIPEAQVQSDWTESNTSDPSYIKHKPDEVALQAGSNINIVKSGSTLTISAVASGDVSLADLAAVSGNLESDIQTVSSAIPDISNLATEAEVQFVSGAVEANANDIQTVSAAIPDAQVNSDWNATSGKAEILNKPDLTVYETKAEAEAVSGVIEGQIQAVSGAIPAAQVNSDWNANSGVAEILNKPDLSVYATHDELVAATASIPVPTGMATEEELQAVSAAIPDISGLATEADLQIVSAAIPAAQVNSDWNSNSGVSQILNKPDLSVYATNTDLQTVSSAIPNVSGFATEEDLQAVSAAIVPQVQSDWAEAVTGDPAYIKNKPTSTALAAGHGIIIEEVSGSVVISASADPQVNSDWDAVSGAAMILNKPGELPVVAGDNISITTVNNQIVISSTGGGSASGEVTHAELAQVSGVLEQDIQTVSSAIPDISNLATEADLQTVSGDVLSVSGELADMVANEQNLIAGTGISITVNGNDVTISSTGGGSSGDVTFADLAQVSGVLESDIQIVSAAIPDVSNFATETELQTVSAAIPDTSIYATESDLNTVSGDLLAVSAEIGDVETLLANL